MQLRSQHILGKKVSLVTENVGVVQQKQQHHHPVEIPSIRTAGLHSVAQAFQEALTFNFPSKVPKTLRQENRAAVQTPGEEQALLNLPSHHSAFRFPCGFPTQILVLPGLCNIIYGKIHCLHAV